ncbi:hypothetical protein VB712_13480 [Spirulina sp. CCNP1310]|uniref:hypothetical protein n=1 Tax=Spirulina sp. CCNP1310 TaxID=3110249 RepID=UPI002B219AE4|nr:hypothetical protein [Spirulina sp. CCNP1310]MEA5420236.1 hypothetical protein [Spirulina sp. CCNP1310]
MNNPSVKNHCDEIDQTFRQLVKHLEQAQKLARQIPSQSFGEANRSVVLIIEEYQQSIRQVNHNLALLESLWKALGHTQQLASQKQAKGFSKAVAVASIVTSLGGNIAGSVNPNFHTNDHLSDSHSMVSENNVKKREDQLDKDTIARNQTNTSGS